MNNIKECRYYVEVLKGEIQQTKERRSLYYKRPNSTDYSLISLTM